MDDPSHKQTEAVRTCLTFLAGACYGGKAIRDQVRTSATHREHWPKDLASLVEAIETEDGAAAREWFTKKQIALPDGRLSDAIVVYLLDYHRSEVARRSVWSICKATQLPAGDLLVAMQRLVAELEAAGIQSVEK